jgi:hypothetical protein
MGNIKIFVATQAEIPFFKGATTEKLIELCIGNNLL